MSMSLFRRVIDALTVLEARQASSGVWTPETVHLAGLSDQEATKVAILVRWAGKQCVFAEGVLTIY